MKYYIFDTENRDGFYTIEASSSDHAYRKWAKSYLDDTSPERISEEVEILKEQTVISTTIVDLDKVCKEEL